MDYSELEKLAVTPAQKEWLASKRLEYDKMVATLEAKIVQQKTLIEKLLLNSEHRIHLSKFNKDDIQLIGKNTNWLGTGRARPDLFLCTIEGIAWNLKFHFDCESHRPKRTLDRKKVKRELIALEKSFANLSDETIRAIALARYDIPNLPNGESASRPLDPSYSFADIISLLHSVNFEAEFPSSSNLRKMWILKTAEAFEHFALPITNKLDGDFLMVLEAIQETVGFDYGEYGTINAIKDILPKPSNS